jgi:hypothetical protein
MCVIARLRSYDVRDRVTGRDRGGRETRSARPGPYREGGDAERETRDRDKEKPAIRRPIERSGAAEDLRLRAVVSDVSTRNRVGENGRGETRSRYRFKDRTDDNERPKETSVHDTRQRYTPRARAAQVQGVGRSPSAIGSLARVWKRKDV